MTATMGGRGAATIMAKLFHKIGRFAILCYIYAMALSKKRTYLDWASAAPISARAKRAFEHAQFAYGNPSAPHNEGRKAKNILEAARVRIARLAEVRAEDVIFTSGATEANNLALSGFVQAQRALDARAPLHILYQPTAHASIVETIAMLAGYGVEVEAIDLLSLKNQIKEHTKLVVVEAVNG